MKQTFEIPKGCNRVTIEQHEDKLVTIFELKKQEEKVRIWYNEYTEINPNYIGFGVEFKEEKPEVKFKDGDIVTISTRWLCGISKMIVLYKKDEECYGMIDLNGDLRTDYLSYGFQPEDGDTIRLATESEKQQLWDALAKVGKQWNAEKKCIEDLNPKRWRAEEGCGYWHLNSYMKADRTNDSDTYYDELRYSQGNYFQTKQKALAAAEKIKELLKQINP